MAIPGKRRRSLSSVPVAMPAGMALAAAWAVVARREALHRTWIFWASSRSTVNWL